MREGVKGNLCILEEIIREMEAARCSAVNLRSCKSSVTKPEEAPVLLTGPQNWREGKERGGTGRDMGFSHDTTMA